MAYNVGSFRHQVQIMRHVEDPKDRNGSGHQHYEPGPLMWCRITDVSGRDFFSAAANWAEDIVTFTMRCGEEISLKDQLRFDGKDFDIVAVNHLGYAGDFEQYRCRWVGAQKVKRDAYGNV